MVTVTHPNQPPELSQSTTALSSPGIDNRSLNVLQIVPSISLVYGGPSQMVRGFSQALSQQGANVTILTTDSNGDNGQAPLDVPLNQPVDQDGYTVRYFHCAPFRRYKFSLDLLKWLYQHAHEFDIAHIHALFSPVSSGAAAIARYRRLPYILRPLGTLDPADLQKKRQLKQIYATLLEKPNIAGAAGLHFTSPQENQVSERFGTQTPGFVIPLGVTPFSPVPQNPNSKIQNSTPTILFMSRIDPKKGLDLLIPALENLLDNGQTFRFVMAGSNPQDPAYEAEVRDRIHASPLGACTTITGFVQGEAKQALLREADIFVLPSYYENFGIAVAEAMAANLPVVISDQVHIHNDIQQAQAGWVCACDVGSLMMGLLEALQNPDQRRQRGENARRCAEVNYSWDAIAQKTITAYRTILGFQTPVR
ncbi:MAG: hormogonium polysaccharide biosynthesis glycosyltransferase HpsP [Leptolyngbyaceae bacterium]|nr:hormogonium polysaccharide biosynthesis glycosyltransferase HpsP [Leptolyngbyaceae bacterium]